MSLHAVPAQDADLARAELARLRNQVPDPKEPLHQQYMDLQRKLGAAEVCLCLCLLVTCVCMCVCTCVCMRRRRACSRC